MDRNEEIEKIKAAREKYEENVLNRVLEHMPEQARLFKTTSDVTIKRLYTPEDIKDADYVRDVGFPGEYPFTRGIYPTGYRGREWTRRQVFGFGTAEETNERFRFLQEQGQTGFSVVFDHPTAFGLGSDDELAEGFVGKEGLAVDTLADMEELFDGIDIEASSTNLITNSPVLFAMFIVVAQKRGCDLKKLRGTLQNQIALSYSAVSNVKFSSKVPVDIIEYCAREMPRWNHTSISVRNTRDAGCTAVQEIAFGLAQGICTCQEVLKRGVDIDDFAPRISFFLNAHNDFFEEIAKYRAMRRMWAKLMRERFKANDPRSWVLRYHVQTSGDALTPQQPLNNIARTTIHGLAAVLGGAQSLHINSFDEGYAIPTEDAAALSLRTQQIIVHESGVTNTVDPLGGSYFVEALTDKLEAEAWKLIDTIEAIGGLQEALRTGWVWQQVEKAAYEYLQQVERGERIVVGVNAYVEEESRRDKSAIAITEYDVSVAEKQIARLNKVRGERDPQKVEEALAMVRGAYQSDENLMPVLIEAVKSYISIGELRELQLDAFAPFTA